MENRFLGMSIEEITRKLLGDGDLWPWFPVLPVKRHSEIHGIECGIIIHPRVVDVYLTNMYMIQENPECISYSSEEELINDGWIVD
jgi:hypothetical protein